MVLHVFVFISPAMEVLYFKILSNVSFSSLISGDKDDTERGREMEEREREREKEERDRRESPSSVQSTLVYNRQVSQSLQEGAPKDTLAGIVASV